MTTANETSATTGLATLLVLADGRLPSGGHAHSGGLEAAVAAGRVSDLSTVEAFLRGRLATTGLVGAAFAAASVYRIGQHSGADPVDLPGRAHDHARENGLKVSDAIVELDVGLDARTPAPALRRASRTQGRALVRAGRAMWTMPALTYPKDGLHHSVAIGVVASAAGLTAQQAALAAAYGSISGPASAAVRLLALDPYPVQAILARLAPRCDDIAERAAAVAHVDESDLPAASAPLLDISAEDHSTWEVRLFAS